MKFKDHTKSLSQSQIIELELRVTLETWFFWSIPNKIEDMIEMSLTEMLELSNFGHINTYTM